MEEQNIDQINAMMSLSEEINVLNQKVKQMVEQLHGTSEGIAALRDISSTLSTKMGQLKTTANSYKPKRVEPPKGAVASKEDGINERERIVPTPENYMDYMDSTPVTAQKKIEEEAPSLAELTTPQSNEIKSSVQLEEEKAIKVEQQKNKNKSGTITGKRTKAPSTNRAKSKRLNRAPKPPKKKKGFFGR